MIERLRKTANCLFEWAGACRRGDSKEGEAKEARWEKVGMQESVEWWAIVFISRISLREKEATVPDLCGRERCSRRPDPALRDGNLVPTCSAASFPGYSTVYGRTSHLLMLHVIETAGSGDTKCRRNP